MSKHLRLSLPGAAVPGGSLFFRHTRACLLLLLAGLGCLPGATGQERQPRQLSGIYPHLAMYNQRGECGVGSLVAWANRLWAVTYAPHSPFGSDDKLYEITPDLQQVIHPESIGGTPASRMIHQESQQAFIGPYAIRASGDVRVIPHSRLPGRLTGNARHLTEPDSKIYYATMEEGIYEVDVHTLDVTEAFADDQFQTGHAARSYERPAPERLAGLPGYHGKGCYSGQGVVIYANNGEPSREAGTRPDIPSGVLAEWDGVSREWQVIRRNQFTEISGPGGISGNPQPATDPIWTVGWDTRSLLLGVRLPESGWTFYRLPKASHSYDGAHGWNTEWPRIRDIGEDSLLMTMHGTLWSFPKTFHPRNSSGIAPRSDYLKIVADFCRWNDRLVLACDDVARSEFKNRRRSKGRITPTQSHSNLWFLDPAELDQLGPAIGRGRVWERDDVAASEPSDPYLFSGYDVRCLHLHHESPEPVRVLMEVDQQGNGQWTPLRETTVDGYQLVTFRPEETGTWIRLTCLSAAAQMTAAFSYHNHDRRLETAEPLFDGLAEAGDNFTGGLLRPRGENRRTLAFAAKAADGTDAGYYELDEQLQLKHVNSPRDQAWLNTNAAIARDVLTVDEASVLFVDDRGNRWRLPKGASTFDNFPCGDYRVDRELVTERDLFNAHGTFYELPSPNSGGFIKIRPLSTHNRLIHDYCSYRGLMVISGVADAVPADNPHVIRSDDGKTALWAGAIDDVWKLGKPRGVGGPWKRTAVRATEASDPYLMTAYDEKTLTLSADAATQIAVEVDITGNRNWVTYETFSLDGEQSVTHRFPAEFSAYWVRFRSTTDCTATAQLEYK